MQDHIELSKFSPPAAKFTRTCLLVFGPRVSRQRIEMQLQSASKYWTSNYGLVYESVTLVPHQFIQVRFSEITLFETHKLVGTPYNKQYRNIYK
jgi:hypothetical protein